ncbi:MAG: nucleotidyl transferase AbiEii/AbiGii toxin family protein, partial [Candidatus Binatia bacterium]
MSEELEVLKQVARRLGSAGIAYMITGSTAANLYTVPRMTRDIDIVVQLLEQDIDRFIPLFEKEYYLEPESVRRAVKDKGMFNLIHEEYIIKIDFIVRKDSPYRRREF